MPPPPGIAVPPLPPPSWSSSFTAIRPTWPAEPCPSPMVPTRRYSEPATIPSRPRTRERRSLPCAYSTLSEPRSSATALPPTLSPIEARRSRPSTSPGIYIIKGEEESRHHLWTVGDRLAEISFPTKASLRRQHDQRDKSSGTSSLRPFS